MGNFYINYSVRKDDPQQVADALRQVGREAIVLPPHKGCIVIFEPENEPLAASPDDSAEDLGILLSRELSAPVLSVCNYDDDVLCYSLFVNGQQSDTYSSDPDSEAAFYEEMLEELREVDEEDIQGMQQRVLAEQELQRLRENPPVGDAAKLCAAFDSDASVDAVRPLLGASYLDALYRHEMLVDLLGLSPYAVGFSYQDIGKGRPPGELTPDQLLHVMTDDVLL